MKIYQILSTIVVSDKVTNGDISNLCLEIDNTITSNFFISNNINGFFVNETVDYPDPTEDKNGESFHKWIEKSQEIIDKKQKELEGL